MLHRACIQGVCASLPEVLLRKHESAATKRSAVQPVQADECFVPQCCRMLLLERGWHGNQPSARQQSIISVVGANSSTERAALYCRAHAR